MYNKKEPHLLRIYTYDKPNTTIEGIADRIIGGFGLKGTYVLALDGGGSTQNSGVKSTFDFYIILLKIKRRLDP
jgi:hypothetical protein